MKKVLPLLLVVTVGFLGLNFFIPSLTLIKTVEAVVTISNLVVNDQGNVENQQGTYELTLQTGATPITTADTVNVNFTGGYSYTGSNWVISLNGKSAGQGGNGQISANISGSKVSIKLLQPNDTVTGQVSIDIFGINNPAAGTYNASVDVNGVSTLTDSVTVAVDTSGGGGSSDTSEGFKWFPGCGWTNMGKCFSAFVTLLPRIALFLIFKMAGFIISGVMYALVFVGGELVQLGIKLNNSL